MSVSKPSAVASVPSATVTLAMRPVTQKGWWDLSQRWAAELEDQYGITLKYEFIGESEWLAQLAARMAGDALPDLIELWPQDVVALSTNLVKELFAPLPPSEGDIPWKKFLSGAIASGKIDGHQYGLPWHRWYCLPDYASLYLSVVTKDRAASLKVMRYLTDVKQQEGCFKLLQWYPTRTDVNEGLGSCSFAGSQYRPLPLTPAQLQALRGSEAVKERAQKIEAALKGLKADYRMLPGITFDVGHSNGIVRSAGNVQRTLRAARDSSQEIPFQAVVVPVQYDLQYFSQSTFSGALEKGITIGALLVQKEEVLAGIPVGEFGVWVQGTKVWLVNSEGSRIDYQGARVEPLYGSRPPETFEGHEGVFATVVVGSPDTIIITVDGWVFSIG